MFFLFNESINGVINGTIKLMWDLSGKLVTWKNYNERSRPKPGMMVNA